MFCSNCGKELPEGAKVCPYCGKPVAGEAASAGSSVKYTDDLGKTAASAVKEFAQNISGTGDGEKVDIHLRDLFSGVFKKHTQEEEDELFICGTSKTTPDIHSISEEWPHPWLFSRVFLFLLVATLLLSFIVLRQGNINGIPGLMFISSLIGPVAVVVFFFETNAPRNISLIQVTKDFLIGGIFSLIVTLMIAEYIYGEAGNFFGALLIGIAEELGKAIAVALCINHVKTVGKRHYILNGLLIGSAVGGGFAVFETAGYVFYFFTMYLLGTGNLSTANDAMFNVILNRGVLSVGGHVIWAAISGAALCVAADGGKIEGRHFLSGKFLGAFLVPVLLHALWDSLGVKANSALVWLALIAAAWAVGLVYVSRGLKEVNNIMENGEINSEGEIVLYTPAVK